MNAVGEVYGKWTVIDTTTIYRARKNRTAYVVRCVCGNEGIREPHRLKTGRTSSCSDCAVRGTKAGPNAKLRKPPTVAAINRYYGDYRRNASKKTRDFDLDRDTFESLVRNDCFYCGGRPSTRVKSDWDEVYVNGVDRIDSNKGYTIDNCVTACWICNSAKKNMTQDDFYDWVCKIHANWQR